MVGVSIAIRINTPHYLAAPLLDSVSAFVGLRSVNDHIESTVRLCPQALRQCSEPSRQSQPEQLVSGEFPATNARLTVPVTQLPGGRTGLKCHPSSRFAQPRARNFARFGSAGAGAMILLECAETGS